MAYPTLAGDLTVFRLEMVIRFLEAAKVHAELMLDGPERFAIHFFGGRIVAAASGHGQGISAFAEMLQRRSGHFVVRIKDPQDLHRQADFEAFADNMALLRHSVATHSGPLPPRPGTAPMAPTTGATPLQGPAIAAPMAQEPGPAHQGPAYPAPHAPVPAPAAPLPSPVAPAPAPPVASTTQPLGPANPFQQNRTTLQTSMGGNAAARPRGAGASGPMGRVPELTDKGKMTLRSIQANTALRGVSAEADTWKVLARVNGQHSLFEISGFVNILGDRFSSAVTELQQQGLIRFQSQETGVDNLRETKSKFRFGEYMVAKGIISQVQLETALRRQQELARRGRYMWLGELLVELNYCRPSQVQEALAVQKRANG
ncbi:MAG: hypothetical protein VKP72_05150 [bacterium]|nr:hypothetical protein [bacterium]